MYYYSKNGQQIGPVSAEVLRQLALGGAISPDDLVWKDAAKKTPARSVKGLFDGNLDVPPPITRQAAVVEVEPSPMNSFAFESIIPNQNSSVNFSPIKNSQTYKPKAKAKVSSVVVIGCLALGMCAVVALVWANSTKSKSVAEQPKASSENNRDRISKIDSNVPQAAPITELQNVQHELGQLTSSLDGPRTPNAANRNGSNEKQVAEESKRVPSNDHKDLPQVGVQKIWKGDGGKFIDVQPVHQGDTAVLTFRAHNFDNRSSAGRKYAVSGLDAATKQVLEQYKSNPKQRNLTEIKSEREEKWDGSTLIRKVVLRLGEKAEDKQVAGSAPGDLNYKTGFKEGVKSGNGFSPAIMNALENGVRDKAVEMIETEHRRLGAHVLRLKKGLGENSPDYQYWKGYADGFKAGLIEF